MFLVARIVNPFLGEEAAALYQRGRPDHHGQAIGAMERIMGGHPVGRALDIGCGTGLSTAALASIAGFTVGLDAAPAMVAIASRTLGSCVVAVGEKTPFAGASFDIITVASTLHWVDRERLFPECRRLLRRGGWLAIYDHFLVGLEGQPAYLDWAKNVYLARYPVPFHGQRFGPRSEVPVGYRRAGDASYDDPRQMTRAQLVEYHLSQSIALMGMRERGETVAIGRAWLDAELRQFVPGEGTSVVRFVGMVSCLQAE